LRRGADESRQHAAIAAIDSCYWVSNLIWVKAETPDFAHFQGETRSVPTVRGWIGSHFRGAGGVTRKAMEAGLSRHFERDGEAGAKGCAAPPDHHPFKRKE